MALEIILPKQVRQNAKWVCVACGRPFFEGEQHQYERHVVGCAEEHEEELMAHSLRVQAPMLYGDPMRGEGPDPELERWIEENRDALIEERKRM